MKGYKIFVIWFSFMMCYQLFSIAISTGNSNQSSILISDSIQKVDSFNIFDKFSISINSLKEYNNRHLIKSNKYSLSKQGKDFIKAHEKCVLHAYNDPDPQRRSVGWGHQIRPGEDLEVITKEKADELFEIDIEWVNEAINRLIKKNDSRFIYTQGFIDGLGSLIYNCGEYGVTKTTFYQRWQNCRYDKNAIGFINMNDWNYTIAGVKISRISAPGHVQRRYDEHLMMLN